MHHDDGYPIWRIRLHQVKSVRPGCFTGKHKPRPSPHRVAIPEGVNAIQMHRITWPQMGDFIRRAVSHVLDANPVEKSDSAWAIHEDSVEYFVGAQASEQIRARHSGGHFMAGLRASGYYGSTQTQSLAASVPPLTRPPPQESCL